MEIIVEQSKSNQRLDKFLNQYFQNFSRNQIQKFIKKGAVKSQNSVLDRPSYRVKNAEVIMVDKSIFEQENNEIKPNPALKPQIIFENNDFLIVNKPAGITVHPVNVHQDNTLINGIIYYYPEIKTVGDNPLRPGIVHRLDKDTSGLMIITKNNQAFQEIKLLFQNHKIKKTYLALVFGKFKNKNGIINYPIARSKQKFNKRKILLRQEPNAKTAITQYKVIKEFKETSLLKVYPQTGRTHQIRVHFAALSHFVIGDKEYGSKKINKLYPFQRQFLHSSKIEFF